MTDEEQVLALIHDRLLGVGQKHYGPLALACDPRDHLQEALEEALDQSLYLAMRIRQIQLAMAKPKHSVVEGDLAQARAAIVRLVSAYDDGAKSDLNRAIHAARELVRG